MDRPHCKVHCFGFIHCNYMPDDCYMFEDQQKLCCISLQDVLLPPGVTSPANSSVLAAGTWLDPSDPLLSQIPPGAALNRCSPGMIVAVIYFCSFVLLCGFVLVNFVIGVIIDNMQSSKTHDDMAVSRYHVEQFVKVRLMEFLLRCKRMIHAGLAADSPCGLCA
eukprot:GHUV01036272.1.p1 GENE.GHUV01036272.1~~GHUV01036272.1.p1  ORF type:complete len:164 (-),score=35.55 GHUV01036272.1:283-774(-)